MTNQTLEPIRVIFVVMMVFSVRMRISMKDPPSLRAFY